MLCWFMCVYIYLLFTYLFKYRVSDEEHVKIKKFFFMSTEFRN